MGCGCKKAKVSGMAKRGKNDEMKFVKMGVAGAATLVATRIATENMSFAASNPELIAGAKVIGGAVLAASSKKDDLLIGAGVGLIVGGALDLIDSFMEPGGFLSGGSSTGTTTRQIGGLARPTYVMPNQYPQASTIRV